jgi:hypothetical protein
MTKDELVQEIGAMLIQDRKISSRRRQHLLIVAQLNGALHEGERLLPTKQRAVVRLLWRSGDSTMRSANVMISYPFQPLAPRSKTPHQRIEI